MRRRGERLEPDSPDRRVRSLPSPLHPCSGLFHLESVPLITTAIRSLAAYVLVSAYVIVVGPIGMLLALTFRWKNLLYVLGHLGVRLGFFFSGIRYTVTGRDLIPPDRAVVFCSNHQSNIDPPVLFHALHPRMHILYKHELDAIPILARAFRVGGFIPIDRRHKESAMRSIDAGAQSIRSGNSFLIFPEGTRSRTGALLPFKKGGFIMAIKAQAPVVPVAIQGGRAAMQRGTWRIQPVTATVRVGPPIETAGLTLQQRDELIERVHKAIEALLRGEAPSAVDTSGEITQRRA
jgi:1-acyl-sn-glycerol-3-phosphate acyltransferase